MTEPLKQHKSDARADSPDVRLPQEDIELQVRSSPREDMEPQSSEESDYEDDQPSIPIKKERPWKQQKLPHWIPIWTPTNVAIPLIIVAIVTTSIGAWAYQRNTKLQEIILDYTRCSTAAPADFAAPSSAASDLITQWKFDTATRTCVLQFRNPSTIESTVHMHIRLTEFYQNHRLMVKSFSADQLKGKAFRSAADIVDDCGWLKYANCDAAKANTWAGEGMQGDMNPDCYVPEDRRQPVIINAAPTAQYYPCGLLANSMFSDDISPLRCISSDDAAIACDPAIPYTFSTAGIAFPEDQKLYGISEWFTDPTLAAQAPTSLIPPPAWRKAFPQWKDGYSVDRPDGVPDLANWERFHVWMRQAGWPTFRKLWGRNTQESLAAGMWEVSIVDSFEVERFNGTKSLVFGKVGTLGSAEGNNFVGIAYLTLGGVSFLLAAICFLFPWRAVGESPSFSHKKQA
ncbi:ligand-effect modulator 3 family [Gaertneriomyces semiglobifer]|nr:ligand-effect modulator 3 family [Gaertneriomyces semiglobifer]